MVDMDVGSIGAIDDAVKIKLIQFVNRDETLISARISVYPESSGTFDYYYYIECFYIQTIRTCHSNRSDSTIAPLKK